MGLSRSKYIVSKAKATTRRVARSMSSKELYGQGGLDFIHGKARTAVAHKIKSMRKASGKRGTSC